MMGRKSAGEMEELQRTITSYGGNIPLRGIYLGRARTLNTYPGGSVVTPEGTKKLVMGADVEVGRWLDSYIQLYRSVGRTEEEIKQLFADANKKASSRVVRLFLTPEGVFYKSGHSISTLHVTGEQIPDAEQILGNVRIVGYTPLYVAGLFGEDGRSIYTEQIGPVCIGGELRLPGEPEQTAEGSRREFGDFVIATLNAPTESPFLIFAGTPSRVSK